MLKILGCILIMAGAGGFGAGAGYELRKHLQQFIEFKETLYVLLCEIRYYKKPLPEAFQTAAENGRGSFGSVFSLIAERLCCFEEAKGSAIWRESFLKYRKSFLFSEEEMEIVLRTGNFLDAPDMETKLRELELYEEQLNRRIDEITGGMAAKRKVCMYGSVLGGLFLIILLV